MMLAALIFLAQADAFRAIDYVLGAGVIGALLALARLFTAMRGLRTGLAEEVMLVMGAKEKEAAKNKLPQPLVVTAEVEFATSGELAELRAENKQEMEKLSRQLGAFETLERDRTGKLHARIDVVDKTLAEQVGVTRGMSERIGEVKQSAEGSHRRMDDVLGAIGELRGEIKPLATLLQQEIWNGTQRRAS